MSPVTSRKGTGELGDCLHTVRTDSGGGVPPVYLQVASYRETSNPSDDCEPTAITLFEFKNSSEGSTWYLCQNPGHNAALNIITTTSKLSFKIASLLIFEQVN